MKLVRYRILLELNGWGPALVATLCLATWPAGNASAFSLLSARHPGAIGIEILGVLPK